MRTGIVVVLALAMLSLGLTACGGDTEDPTPEPKTDETAPEQPTGGDPDADRPADKDKKPEHPRSEHPR